VNVRLAGAEIIAKDSGKHWKTLIKHVGQRLNRQLKKRSSLKRRKMLYAASPARA
jgi:ribosome-associated translation inhibitor RaiA